MYMQRKVDLEATGSDMVCFVQNCGQERMLVCNDLASELKIVRMGWRWTVVTNTCVDEPDVSIRT